MTDRERWTVYPLLFLALALTLRDKVAPTTPATLTTRQMTIVGEDGRPNILLRGSDQKGAAPAIEILNAKGKPAWVVSVRRDGLGIENTGSVIARDFLVVGADDKQRVAMGVTDNGKGAGRTEWFDANQNMVLAAGGAASDSGAISSFRPGNIPQFSFGTNERGSIVIVRDLKGKPYFVLMGDDRGEGRALLFDGEGNGQLIVGNPINIKLNEVPAPPAEPAAGEQAPPAEQSSAEAPAEPPSEQAETPAEEQKPVEEKPAEEKPAEATPTEEKPQ